MSVTLREATLVVDEHVPAMRRSIEDTQPRRDVDMWPLAATIRKKVGHWVKGTSGKS